MMPGDSQSKTVAIAADATIGNCQNCSVLHQSLNEYVSSFLALKQEIAVSAEKTQLQQQLEELQIKLLLLEKKAADYEFVQAELEEKKGALQAYEQMSEEIKTLKQENSKMTAENKKLEDELNNVKELTETQSLENAQLTREKAAVENDLLKAQTSLMESQARADQVVKLMEEKAETTLIKETLESKVHELEESVCIQNQQLSQITKEKMLLQRNVTDLQSRLIRLERERSKDYRSTSSQASVLEEPKVDREKIRMLLEDLWACVEPQQQNPANRLYLPESCSQQVLPSSPKNRLRCNLNSTSQSPDKISESCSSPVRTKPQYTQVQPSLQCQNTIKHPACRQPTRAKKKTDTPRKGKQMSEEQKTEEFSTKFGSSNISLEEVMSFFKPILPCLSPLPDLGTEMDSMETDDGEKQNDSKKSDDAVHLETVESSLNTTSVSGLSPKSSIAQMEDTLDLPTVITQKTEYISSDNASKDLGQSGLRVNTEMEDIICMNNEETQLEEDMQSLQEPATDLLISVSASSASFVSETTVSAEVVSQNTDRQKVSSSETPNSRSSNSLSEMENAKDDKSETFIKMDIDLNLSGVTGARTENSESGELTDRNDTILIPKEDGDIQRVTSPIVASLFTENIPETGEVQQDFLGRQETTVLHPKENKECLVEETCLSSSPVSNKNAEEGLENDAAVKLPVEEDKNEVQGKMKEGDNETTNGHNKLLSPCTSSLLRLEYGKYHHDKESSCKSSTTPSKKDANLDILDTKLADHVPSFSDNQEMVVSCKTLKENTHSVCRASNPTCLFPTLKVQALGTHPKTEQLDVGVNIEPNSTNKKSLQSEPNKEKQKVIENANARDLPEDSIDGSNHGVRECKLGAAGAPTSLKQSANRQSKCSESKEQICPVAGSDTDLPPEFLGQVFTEMGPPLPPVLTPVSTPPKAGKSINPRQAIGKLSFPSPMDHLASPGTPVKAQLTPNSQQHTSSSLNSPVRPSGVLSSPLQFGSATPKHAVPVPGRLPRTALNPSTPPSSSPSQENSMRILDTMYPDLSANARTLSILRGNVGLTMSSSESGTATVGQMSGFKTINSTSTAFTKTETRGEKRLASSLPQPKNRKCLRLDDCSPVSRKQLPSSSSTSGDDITSPQPLKRLHIETPPPSIESGAPTETNLIDSFLEKIEKQCFDLLPVLQSHLYVGSLPKKPVLRDEEREVISEICRSSSCTRYGY
ncbi:little elongation complex subunit 1 isoform X2 [Cheilinus undulatus]|uniref:little elongation complex subunit 1 isoform X2 n=1 Tax=Cheilinus undulatus TaxID=241271 RepID=UPI001BD1F037|nr:little elongation complex subunit 1 isoform X2 [Cheilinus undulatus]